jgi:uncharacterized damage-inducible protein DinB
VRIADTLIQELEQEGKTTRRVLDRVPAEKLTWKPHEKSLSIGQLALHLARLNGGIAPMAVSDTFELVGNPFQFAEASNKAEIMATFDEGLTRAKTVIGAMDDATITGLWTMKMGDKTIMNMPRVALFRALLCNHAYHHRGQLSVYLRLLNVEVPSIYGPRMRIRLRWDKRTVMDGGLHDPNTQRLSVELGKLRHHSHHRDRSA